MKHIQRHRTDMRTGDPSASEIACPARHYKTMLALSVGKGEKETS